MQISDDDDDERQVEEEENEEEERIQSGELIMATTFLLWVYLPAKQPFSV